MKDMRDEIKGNIWGVGDGKGTKVIYKKGCKIGVKKKEERGT